jgi:hypothetical protein
MNINLENLANNLNELPSNVGFWFKFIDDEKYVLNSIKNISKHPNSNFVSIEPFHDNRIIQYSNCKLRLAIGHCINEGIDIMRVDIK